MIEQMFYRVDPGTALHNPALDRLKHPMKRFRSPAFGVARLLLLLLGAVLLIMVLLPAALAAQAASTA